jgi:hypothetical protein
MQVLRILALGGFLAAVAVIGNGCETGGKEGDRCNALVEQDECNSGLHCQQVTCDRTYCCPTNGSSREPNCNGDGCPSEDAGDEGGESGADADLEASDDGGDSSIPDAADAADAADQ